MALSEGIIRLVLPKLCEKNREIISKEVNIGNLLWQIRVVLYSNRVTYELVCNGPSDRNNGTPVHLFRCFAGGLIKTSSGGRFSVMSRIGPSFYYHAMNIYFFLLMFC